MAHNDRRKPCGACDREVAHTLDGRPYTHKCFKPEPDANGLEDPTPRGVTKFPAVSDPAPTVEPMDDTHCKQGGCKGCCGCSSECTDTPCGQPFKGPWFGAMRDGRCSVSECRIDEGDRIRADGQGGYECEGCGDTTLADNGTVYIPAAVAFAPDVAEDSEFMKMALDAMTPPADGAMPRVVIGDPPDRLTAVTMTRSQALATLAAEGPDADMASLAFEREQEEAARVLSAHPYVTIPDPPVRNVVELRLPTAPGPMPVPDEFEDPTAPADVPDVLNVSGQPKARYQWRGSQNMGYLVKDPTTGDFRRYKNQNPMGWTRATTFNKAASSTTSLTAWKLRNVIIGAARRPDALLRAHGLTHKDARQLDQIAADLEEVAGAKVGSDIGTFLHEFTEHMDAGLKTWRDAPPQYQEQLALYAKTLADAGFEAVPGLIERTTCITEFGGVVGTFDRVLYHRPSGTYAIGDLKTGKTMDYARLETECQEWIYAHGVNQNGVYDWNTDTWRPVSHDAGVPNAMPPLVRVSEEWGLIIHMPVQGDDAGKVFLERADLQRGARYAETCAENRGWSRPKRELWSWGPPASPAPEPQLNETSDEIWRALFRNATTSESATALWKRAKETGVHGVFLNELIGLARESIRSHS